MASCCYEIKTLRRPIHSIKWLLGLLMALDCIITIGCSPGSLEVKVPLDKNIEQAMQCLLANAPKADADPTRPVFHFRPPAQWMNDICGALYHKGYYHIFYQINPFSSEAPWDTQQGGWGHARSRDLVYWEHLPIAIIGSPKDGDLFCGSGCAKTDDTGNLILFFTYTPKGFPSVPRQQWAALPLDEELVKWQKVDIDLAPGSSGIPANVDPYWADPFVFRDSGKKLMIFKACNGLVCEAQNPDLTRWKCTGRIAGIEGETPNFTKICDKYLMITSGTDNSDQTQYKVGTFDSRTLQFTVQNRGVIDHAYGPKRPHPNTRGFYGTTLFEGPKGRHLLLGWAGGYRKGRSWNGCMGLPREIIVTPDNRVKQQPVKELQVLRTNHRQMNSLEIGDQPYTIRNIGNGVEMILDIDLRDAKNVGLVIADSKNDNQSVTISFDGDLLNVAGTKVSLIQTNRLNLHVFLDRLLLEVFVNDGSEVITRELDACPTSPNLELTAKSGQIVVNRLEIWQMKSVW